MRSWLKRHRVTVSIVLTLAVYVPWAVSNNPNWWEGFLFCLSINWFINHIIEKDL